MAEFENVIFGDEYLHKKIRQYSKERKITFSRAVQELSSGGLLLFKETGNIPPFTSLENMERAKHFIRSFRKKN